MKRIKELLYNTKYKIKSKWSSFTYIFRRPYYRLRLFKRFYKTPYYGAWEMCNPLLDYPFEIFCEFYEKGDMEHICYDDSPWRETKEEMDFLYNWYTVEKQKRQDEIDFILTTWSEHHVGWSKPIKYKGVDCYSWQCMTSKYGDYLFEMLGNLEKNFYKEEEACLIRLMKIRNFLWT